METTNETPRGSCGRFQRRCGSSIHKENVDPSLYLIDLQKRRRISVADVKTLLSLNIINNNTKYICRICVTSAIEKEETDDDKDDENDGNDNFFDDCVRVGQALNKLIANDLNSVKMSKLNSIEDINNFNLPQWLFDRPKELIHLLCSICNIDINTTSTKKMELISKTIELLYYCSNSKLVLPSHFFENLLCYTLTNSKSLTNFMGSRSPGGAYTYITKWLRDQSKNEIPFPKGLVKSVFDNSQKVGKTYLISETNIVPTSVITSHLWIVFDESSKLQENIRFKPSSWMSKDIDESSIINRLTKPTDNFRVSRNNFIEKCLSIVKDEIEENNKSDNIDSIIQQEAETNAQKRCVDCGMESDPSYRVCRNPDCGGRVTKEKIERNVPGSKGHKVDPYQSFATSETFLPEISCQAGEPDFINPNGYHNIIQVIKAIGIRAGIFYLFFTKKSFHYSRRSLLLRTFFAFKVYNSMGKEHENGYLWNAMVFLITC